MHCADYVSGRHPGAELVGEGRYALVYRLKNGNALKFTSCGPSIEWLTTAAKLSGNPYLPRIIRHHGCIHETAASELHAFELEWLNHPCIDLWPETLTKQVQSIEAAIKTAQATDAKLSDQTFWQKYAKSLVFAILPGDNHLGSLLHQLFRVIVSYRGRAYPDFTSLARRNIMMRPNGDCVFMDPVASLVACRPLNARSQFSAIEE
jgi:hypothetical protein